MKKLFSLFLLASMFMMLAVPDAEGQRPQYCYECGAFTFADCDCPPAPPPEPEPIGDVILSMTDISDSKTCDCNSCDSLILKSVSTNDLSNCGSIYINTVKTSKTNYPLFVYNEGKAPKYTNYNHIERGEPLTTDRSEIKYNCNNYTKRSQSEATINRNEPLAVNRGKFNELVTTLKI